MQIAISQTGAGLFVVGNAPHSYMQEWWSDHKIWIQVFNDDEFSSHDYTIEIISFENSPLVVQNYIATGYTLSTDSNPIVGNYNIWSKTINLESAETFTDVVYIEPESSVYIYETVLVRVVDDNDDYLERLGGFGPPIGFDSETTWELVFRDYDHNDRNLFDNDQGANPVFLKDCNNTEDYTNNPIPDVREPLAPSSFVEWFVLGKVFIDVTGSYESQWDAVINDTYETWDEPFSYENDPGLYRYNIITLIDEQSQFSILGETHFIGHYLQVVGGTKIDSAENKTFHMGGGLLVGSDATLTLNDAIVQDQMEGITLEAGATLNANDTYFTDNLVSIRVKAGDPNKITKINLSQVQFAGIGQLKTSPEGRHYPFAHIKIDPGAKVEINVVDQIGLGVKMLQADYGIYSEGDLVTVDGLHINYEFRAMSVLGLGGYRSPAPEDFPEVDYTDFDEGPIVLMKERERGIGIFSATDNTAYSQYLTVNATSTTPLKVIYPNIGMELDNVNANIRNVYIEDALTYGIDAYTINSTSPRNLTIKDTEINIADIGIRNNSQGLYGTNVLIDNAAFIGVLILHKCNFRLADSEIYSANMGIQLRVARDGFAQIKDTHIEAVTGIDQVLSHNNNVLMTNSFIESSKYGFLSRFNTQTINFLTTNEFDAGSTSQYFNTSSAIFNRSKSQFVGYENIINLQGAKYGVNLLNSDYNFFEDNFVEFSGTQSASYNKGIGMNIKGGISNTLTCNTINQQIIGSSIGTIGIASNISHMNSLIDNNLHDVSVGIQFYNDNSDARVIRNYFDGHIFGLSYGEETSLGYNIAFTGDQVLRGNLWFDENNVLGFEDANFFGLTQQAGASAYIVNSNHNPVSGGKTMPDDINPPSGWFFTDPMNQNSVRTQTCSSLDLLSPQLPLASEGQVNFLKMNYDSINFGYYDTEIKANYYRIFYKELLKENVDFTYTESQINYRLDQLGVNKDLVEVQYLIESSIGGEIKTFEQQDSLVLSIEDIEAELLNYFALPDTALSALSTKWTEITTMFENIYSGGDSIDFTALETALTALPNRHLYTDPESTLHYVLLGQVRYMKGDTASYTNMRPNIMDIALSCPFEFGEAVYIARSLIGEDYPLSYEDFSMCDEDNQPRSKENEVVFGELKVYPVPSAGILNVELPEEAERLDIYSTGGKLVRTMNIFGMTRTEIQLDNSGVYQIQVHKKDGSIDHQKVIIVK